MEQKVVWVTSRIVQAFLKGVNKTTVNAKKNEISEKNYNFVSYISEGCHNMFCFIHFFFTMIKVGIYRKYKGIAAHKIILPRFLIDCSGGVDLNCGGLKL